jgi:hypothetical protein
MSLHAIQMGLLNARRTGFRRPIAPCRQHLVGQLAQRKTAPTFFLLSRLVDRALVLRFQVAGGVGRTRRIGDEEMTDSMALTGSTC